MDTISLIQNGLFDEACKQADIEYEQTKDISVLRTKVLALLELGRYGDCIQLTTQIIEISGGNISSDFIDAAIAYWLTDRKKEAISFWQQAENCQFQDAAGGMDILVFQYFAALKMNDSILKKEALGKIKKKIKTRQSANWPGIAGHFLADKVSAEDILSVVSNVPILKERHLCQAYFVIAVKAFENNDIDSYEENLKSCVNYGQVSRLEQMYYLAKGELEASRHNNL